MEIRGSDLLYALSKAYETTSSTSSASSIEESSSLRSSRSESLDISVLGKLRSAISGMSDEEKEEIQSFHEAMMEAVKNGTFDASEMAASTPESLKSFAEENGVDLEGVLEADASRMKSGAAPPGPPPMMASGLGEAVSGTSDEEEEEILSFLEKMMQSIEDGTFDASEMAKSAPESLKSYAEQNGVDLESALADQATMMEKYAAQGPPPPPPSPDMYGSDGYGKGYSSQELSLDLLAKWAASEESEKTTVAGISQA
jgi:hypothetical protein